MFTIHAIVNHSMVKPSEAHHGEAHHPITAPDLRKAETVARYGEGAVDQELPLADKLRRDGDRTASIFGFLEG